MTLVLIAEIPSSPQWLIWHPQQLRELQEMPRSRRLKAVRTGRMVESLLLCCPTKLSHWSISGERPMAQHYHH